MIAFECTRRGAIVRTGWFELDEALPPVYYSYVQYEYCTRRPEEVQHETVQYCTGTVRIEYCTGYLYLVTEDGSCLAS